MFRDGSIRLNIGTHSFPKTAALAPMAGFADRAFREICREMGACYVVGEMASAKGIVYGSAKTRELLEVTDAQRPMGLQLFGNEPETMARAARTALEYAPDFLDINMGCPAPKITGGGAGSALHRNVPLAGEIMRAVAGGVNVPVTVKIRLGWDDGSQNAPEMAQAAQAAGIAAVAVHGRTRARMYAPPVDLNSIREVKRSVSIPVIGNGDVTDIESAEHMYEQTGCDLVMVGRGALGRPWVFSQIHAWFLRGERLPEPDMEEKMGIMLRQIRLACLYKGEYAAMREARSHAAWYLRGMRGAAALRRKAGTLSHFEDLEALAREALDMQAGPGGI